MADFDFKEYTRMRDIAQKRVKRMGLNVHIPTVKELRNDTGDTVVKAFQNLSNFLETGPSLSRRRAAERAVYTPEERSERRREYQRDYRRRKVAQEHEKTTTSKTYQTYLKGIKRLGVDIPPSKLPAFFAYMDYRFAQGNTSKKYVFDIFVDDYQTMLEKGYKPNQLLEDFKQFEADQAALKSRAKNMDGMTVKKAIALWDKFIGNTKKRKIPNKKK